MAKRRTKKQAPVYDERKWLNDPGDERDVPEEEEFEDCLALGWKPEDLADRKFAARYARWLKKQARKG
jgi:hypothetical protein